MNKKEALKTGLLAVSAMGLMVQSAVIHKWSEVSAYQGETIIKTLEVDTPITVCKAVELVEAVEVKEVKEVVEAKAQATTTAQATAKAESKDSGKVMYNIHIKTDNKVNNHDKINSNNNNSKKVK